MQLSAKSSTSSEPLNFVIESHGHDGVFSILNDLALPFAGDDVVDSGNVNGSNRDTDIANTYWEDPFHIGGSGMGGLYKDSETSELTAV